MANQNQGAIEGPDITNYWQYFNMDRDPFTMNGDDTLTYLPSYWEEMLDLIQYLVHYKNQLIVVSGPNGIGKSTISELLLNQLGESVHVAKIPAEPNLNVPRLIEFLSDAFTVPWRPEQSIEQALDEELQAFQSKEKNCLLLIDNAQLLPTETLEALLYLVGQQSENQMRFHALLLGEGALQQTLQTMLEPAEESLVHFLNLEPLSLEETQQYLNHRLSVAGWQNQHPMSEEIVARIYRLSEGNPSRVNRIARRFLLDMLNDQDGGEPMNWWQKNMTKILGGVLVVALLLLIGVWVWRTNNMPTTPAVEATAPSISVNGQPLQPATPQTAQALPPAPPTLPAAANNEAPTSASVTPSNSAAVLPPAPTAANQPAQMVYEPAAPAATASAPTASTSTAPAPDASTPPAVQPPQPVAQSPLPPPPVSIPAAVDATSSNVTEASPAPAVTVYKTHHDESRARKLIVDTKKPQTAVTANNAYTIHLIKLDTVAANGGLMNFVNANHFKGKIREQLVYVKGEPRIYVLYGKYSTMADAQRAVATLPATLYDQGPWPIKTPTSVPKKTK